MKLCRCDRCKQEVPSNSVHCGFILHDDLCNTCYKEFKTLYDRFMDQKL